MMTCPSSSSMRAVSETASSNVKSGFVASVLRGWWLMRGIISGAVIVALSAAIGTTACECDDCGGFPDLSPQLQRTIRGTVTTPAGAPVAGANVQLLLSPGCAGELVRDRQTLTGNEGRYAFLPYKSEI